MLGPLRVGVDPADEVLLGGGDAAADDEGGVCVEATDPTDLSKALDALTPSCLVKRQIS